MNVTMLAPYAMLWIVRMRALLVRANVLAPTCPRCFIKMTARRSTRQGRQFWGCRNYPRCKQLFAGAVPT